MSSWKVPNTHAFWLLCMLCSLPAALPRRLRSKAMGAIGAVGEAHSHPSLIPRVTRGGSKVGGWIEAAGPPPPGTPRVSPGEGWVGKIFLCQPSKYRFGSVNLGPSRHSIVYWHSPPPVDFFLPPGTTTTQAGEQPHSLDGRGSTWFISRGPIHKWAL